MSSTESLLTTKLYLPPRRATLVPRARLLALLGEGMSRPLTLVSAPAGFGKTTLLSEWHASEAGRVFPIAWLSLDNGDNAPARFLMYLIAALGTLKDGIGEGALDILQLQQPPPVNAILTALVNDLQAFPVPFVLVLDDYHVITSRPVHEVLKFLLDNQPSHMHLILLTRADPPLPLARLRARNQLTEIRVPSLRFLPVEATQFMNEVMGLGLSIEDVAALDLRTEGWIAGLQLATISLRQQADKHAFVTAFTGDDGYLFAVNARTGKQMWKFDMGRPITSRKPVPESWDYMQSSPAVADGVVYSGTSNQNFYAVDAKTGREKWHVEIGLYVRSSPVVVNGVVYFGDWLGTAYALDTKTGQSRWTFNTYGPVVPSPTVVDGVVYVGSKFPCEYALDARTGQEKWRFSFGSSWVESSAAVVNGTVYVGSSDWQRVSALDAATGELKWYFQTKGDPWCSPAVSNGVVYIGATGGYFYALDAVSGAELWTVKTDKALKTVEPARFDGGVVSSPTVEGGVVYFGGLDGKLYAVSTAP